MFFSVIDAILIAASFWLAFLIRFDGQIPYAYGVFIPRLVALAILIIIPVFYFQRLYFFSWSYVSASEAIAVFKATVISFIILSIALFLLKNIAHVVNFPRSIILIAGILVFVLCGALRFGKRIFFEFRRFAGMGGARTLIVGAGDAGEQIVRNIYANKNGAYKPVGFVDDNPIKQGVKIHGLKVLGSIKDIPRVVSRHAIEQLVIAIPSANNKIIKEAVALGRSAGLWKIKIAPPIHEIIRGEVSLKNLKDIDVEDLLGRESVTLNKDELERCIKNQVVLVTGAAGSIGSELCRQIARFAPSLLVMVDQDETGIFNIAKELKIKFEHLAIESIIADVADEVRIRGVFKAHAPDIVFHAAAYKHVPLMEHNLGEAVKNNIFGTKHVAQACVDTKVKKCIFISTDKAINPTSVMGATKRIGEMLCQAMSGEGSTAFISVRFGNVLNSRGSVIPIFKEQIRRGGPVEVTHPDMKRYFMLISEACLLVMQAGAMGKGGEVFVLDMGNPIKIVDLAKEMIRLSGFKPDQDIAIVFTGLRPGEKLFEEIMTADENTFATQHQKIFVAKLSSINAKELQAHMEHLARAVGEGSFQTIKDIFKSLIPGYNTPA